MAADFFSEACTEPNVFQGEVTLLKPGILVVCTERLLSCSYHVLVFPFPC